MTAVDGAQFLAPVYAAATWPCFVAGLDPGQPCPSGGGEILIAAAHPPVSIQRVATAAAMPTCLLMHPGERRRRRQIPAAPHQRVEHPHPVRPPGRQGRTVTAERIQRRHFNPRGPLAGLVREPLGQHFSAVSGNDVNELSAVQVDSSGGEHRRLDRAGASERGLIGRRSRWRTRRAGPAGAIEHCARGQRPSPWPTRPPSSRATAATE